MSAQPVTVTYRRKRSGQEFTVTWDLGSADKNDLAALEYAIRSNASIVKEGQMSARLTLPAMPDATKAALRAGMAGTIKRTEGK